MKYALVWIARHPVFATRVLWRTWGWVLGWPVIGAAFIILCALSMGIALAVVLDAWLGVRP
jgi:hypothetical protein